MEILIAEDEQSIADSLRRNFLAEGHSAIVAGDGLTALEIIENKQFDAILLDWRMPKLSGLEVCKRLRHAGNLTPIILLTALNEIKNKIEALESGADDYVTKPFSFEEVLARIKAVQRRVVSAQSVIEFNDNKLDLINHALITAKGSVKLSDKEYELLKYFLTNKGTILSKDQLCSSVWNLNFNPSTNIVEVTVKNLRKKLEEATNGKYIQTIYGEGYIFIGD